MSTSQKSTQGPVSPPKPATTTSTWSRATERQARVLACVLCQQRKIKCDRKFLCVNCVKASARCVQATLAPRRRRRRPPQPERELLDRLRHYETLLRENNVSFEPLPPTSCAAAAHSPPQDHATRLSDQIGAEGSTPDADRPSVEGNATKSKTEYEAKDVWLAMHQTLEDSEDDGRNDDSDGIDDENQSSPRDLQLNKVHAALNQLYENNEPFLFGSRQTNVDVSTLHPEKVQIFRLWQIYLDNVAPLLKVTHDPTLQATIINAVGNLANIEPALEALMFSIYCVSILSLTQQECQTSFGSRKVDILKNYQFGCQQALLNSGFLRTNDRDCLTALYLYLISIRPDTAPRSMCSTLGTAIRIAQRIGIHNEALNAKCTPFEAEMRRRLWWSLVMFDNRMSELGDQKNTTLTPTWDCRLPANASDFDIQPELKSVPVSHNNATEALFVVVRSELGDFIRHTTSHLDFTNPALKKIARTVENDREPGADIFAALEKEIEHRYLKFCNAENSLHFMAFWSTRAAFAKGRMMDHFARHAGSSAPPPDEEDDSAVSNALALLEADTHVMTSPLTQRYLWLIEFHFPFPAYIHIVQSLRRRPNAQHAGHVWRVLSENYAARSIFMQYIPNPFFRMLGHLVVQAWEACEMQIGNVDELVEVPGIVVDVKEKLFGGTMKSQAAKAVQQDPMDVNLDDFSMLTLPSFEGVDMQGGIGWEFPDVGGQTGIDLNLHPLDWTAMSGNPLPDQGWGLNSNSIQ